MVSERRSLNFISENSSFGYDFSCGKLNICNLDCVNFGREIIYG